MCILVSLSVFLFIYGTCILINLSSYPCDVPESFIHEKSSKQKILNQSRRTYGEIVRSQKIRINQWNIWWRFDTIIHNNETPIKHYILQLGYEPGFARLMTRYLALQTLILPTVANIYGYRCNTGALNDVHTCVIFYFDSSAGVGERD